MSQRVLSTDQARETISEIQRILEGGLNEQIQQLNQRGTVLSDPNVWDGPLAQNFRSEVWPSCKSSLDKTLASLTELRTQISRINDNIMQAGGNA